MFDIGGNLAAARKGQGLTLPDAERLTMLRAHYLGALEQNDFDALPGRVYARAFLRTYADALGLESDELVDEFDARNPEPDEEKPAPALIRPRHSPRIGPRGLLVLVVAAAFVGAFLWSTLSAPPKPTPSASPPAAAAPKPRVAQSVPPRATAVQRHFPLVIRATSGPCWLLVRRGGLGGPVLYEGTLAQGASMHFSPRVWVRVGAPWNVDIHRGARVVGGLSGNSPLNITA